MPPKILLILSENWTIVEPHRLDVFVDWAEKAERAGIWGVMTSEHICLGPTAGDKGRESNERAYMAPGNQDPATPWPYSPILNAAIASRTTKLKLALCAIIAPLRHPVDLAKQLATLDCLSNGRLIIQPTVSWHKDEYDCLNVPFGKRGKMLDEHLQAMRALWQPSPASYAGEYYQFSDCFCDPKPVQPNGPEMWFGGQSMSPFLMRRIAEYGSGFHPFGLPSDEDLAMLREGLESAGKDFESFPKVGGVQAKLTDNDKPANLKDSIPSIYPQLDKGFNTICVKPNQFIDDPAAIDDFLGELVLEFSTL